MGVKGISVSDEVFTWGAERSLDVQGEWTQAPSTGRGEEGQLQDVLVEVHGDVRAQLIREVVQQLEEKVRPSYINS